MVGVAVVVWLSLAGCAHSVNQRASGWLVLETRNIELRTNVRRDAAVGLAREMQASYDILARYALPCAKNRRDDRVQVTVLPYWQFLDDAPAGAGGYYRRARATWLADHDGEIVLPDDLGPEPRKSFLHEMTHRLVESCFVRVPPWVNEGLAEFFSTMAVRSGEVLLGRAAYLISTPMRRITERNPIVDGQRVGVLSIESMFSVESLLAATTWPTHDARESYARYATAWALVHLLVVDAPDLAPRFQAYLAELRRPHADPRALFAKRFEGVPLQDRLDEHLRRGDLQMLRALPFVAPGEDLEPRVRDLPEEDSHLHLAWLSSPPGDSDSRERREQHLAAAKRRPRTRAAASVVAAYALMLDRDIAGAEREVQAGLREAPDDPGLLEAQLDLRLGRKASAAELTAAADRLHPVAKTSGAVCSLAEAALRTGDVETARQLAARAVQLDPRGRACLSSALATLAPP